MINVFPLAKHGTQTTNLKGLASLLPLALILVALISVVLLVQVSGVAAVGYDVLRLEQERDDWKQQNYQLQSEAEGLRSLARIEDLARNKLKMERAKQPIYVTVDGKP